MSERELSTETSTTPSVHTLRVAIFDLFSHRLISRDYTTPSLFEDNQQFGPRGQHTSPIEYRATSIGRRIKLNENLPVHILPSLEPLGYLGSLADNPTGFAVATGHPFNLRNFASGLRGYDLHTVNEAAQLEVREPGSTTIDPVDARFLVTAFQRIRPLKRHIQDLA
ncbi:MAG: hypothetical protein WAQ27_06390 [Candidatus Microsaccharimonas sp.]